MKLSVLIPVFNEEKNLPRLFRALAREARRFPLELVFVDNGSVDRSFGLLKEFKRKQRSSVLVVREKKRGFAPPLNRAVKEASSELLVCLDADAVPENGWAKAMHAALLNSDIVVGNTITRLGKNPSEAEKMAADLFRGFSRRAAEGKSHALPWGPACNLGFRRSVWKCAGKFDPKIGSAFDLAWCWRALEAGCSLKFAPRAVVNHARRKTERDFLRQMHRYGTGEAVLARKFRNLQKQPLEKDPQVPARLAYERLRVRLGKKPLAKRVAAAFASGVMLGYSRLRRRSSSLPPWQHASREN